MPWLVLRVHPGVGNLHPRDRVSSGTWPVDHVTFVSVGCLVQELQPFVNKGIFVVIQLRLNLSMLFGEVSECLLSFLLWDSFFIFQARSTDPLPGIPTDVGFNSFGMNPIGLP